MGSCGAILHPNPSRGRRAEPDRRELPQDDLPDRQPPRRGRRGRDGRAGAGPERLAGDGHGDAQDALRGQPRHVYPVRRGQAHPFGSEPGLEGAPAAPAPGIVPRPDPPDDLGRGPRGGRAHGARGLRAAGRPDRRLPRPPGGRPPRRPDPPARRLAHRAVGTPLAQLGRGATVPGRPRRRAGPRLPPLPDRMRPRPRRRGGTDREPARGRHPRLPAPRPRRRPRVRGRRQDPVARQADENP